MRSATWGAAAALGMLTLGCGGGDSPAAPKNVPTDSTAYARDYLSRAIDTMQTRAFYRRRVDWPTVRATAQAMGAGATNPSGTYPAIRYALTALGDRHSFLQTSATGTSANLPPSNVLGGQIVGGRYGYLSVPTFSGTYSAGVDLADTLQGFVRALDAQTPCGWVIDLRHNLGGNMWAMLVGVGPLLGATGVGAFIDGDGGTLSWWYENGSAGASRPGFRDVYAAMSSAPYTLKQPNAPIAILTDSLTASSGEAIVVAFRGRPDTRSFGGATRGVPTGNLAFTLGDGALLILTTVIDADRAGRQYEDAIPPDVVIPQAGSPAANDATVLAATSWLATQPACAAP